MWWGVWLMVCEGVVERRGEVCGLFLDILRGGMEFRGGIAGVES